MVGIFIHEGIDYKVKKGVINALNMYNIDYIGIFIKDIEKNKKIIDMCNGIIIPGGTNPNNIELELIKYIYDKDIPLLGICLGMQEMGLVFDGELKEMNIYSHLKPNVNYAHEVKINKKTRLYEIIKNDNIKVNSRHKDYLVKTNLNISSINDVIESIEDKTKRFFIGVQWHPEDMIEYDLNSKLLFEEFIKEVKKR